MLAGPRGSEEQIRHLVYYTGWYKKNRPLEKNDKVHKPHSLQKPSVSLNGDELHWTVIPLLFLGRLHLAVFDQRFLGSQKPMPPEVRQWARQGQDP
jgi:hypothetical protein